MEIFSYFRDLIWGREMKLMIFGFDGAGKSTILYRLQLGEVVNTITTTGFNVEKVKYRNRRFNIWDLRRHGRARVMWPLYYGNTDAIIYVVDSTDRENIGISKDELCHLLTESDLEKAVLLVLANKQDLAGCLTVSEVHEALRLDSLCNRTCQIFKSSAVTGEGLDKAMDWLCSALQARK